MGPPLRALIIEDSENDAQLLIQELRRGGYDPNHERVQTAAEMRAALARREWDVVLADYTLPEFSATAALALLQEQGYDLPFIIVSGSIGEDVAVAAMKAGAHDYLMKGRLKRLIPSIQRELRDARTRAHHRRAEENLRQSEQRFRELAEHITEVFWITDPVKREILYVSPGYEKIWGRSCASLYERPGSWMEAIHPDDRGHIAHLIPTQITSAGFDTEYRILRPDGTLRWIRDRAYPVNNAAGEIYRVTGIAEDITEHKRAEEALRNAKDFSEKLIQTANVIILSLDVHGEINIFNETAEKITGYTLAELRGKNWFEVLAPKARYPQVWEEFSRLVAGGIPQVFENPILTKSGEERHIMWQNNQIKVGEQVIATISFGNDVTDRKRAVEALKESEERLRMAIDAARMYTWDWDIEHDRLIRSGHHQDIYGTEFEVAGKDDFVSLLAAIHPDDRSRVAAAIERTRIHGDAYHTDFRIMRPDGSIRWLETQGRAYQNAAGKVVRMMGVTQDITERKLSEALIEQMAYYDTLTALPNRNTLYDRLVQAMQNGADRPFALLLMDLDHFKEINDTLGHQSGDLLINEVAKRLRAALSASAVVARLGGDEFAVLLPDSDVTAKALAAVDAIQQALHPPVMIEGLPVAVEASIGIAVFPDHGTDPDSLLRHADVAMYAAKKAGSNAVIYDSSYDRHSTDRLARMAELRTAIDEGQLVLHYQPKIDLERGRLCGVEALVRWQHPQRGMIPPDQFIGPAEQTGLIHPLTRWVLQAAIRQCGDWQRAGHRIPVAINLSARNLFDPQLPEHINELLARHAVPAELITLEITESAIMADPGRAAAILHRIHDAGIGLSIDDFGVGYSSLEYLRRLPVGSLKIDRSFVIRMSENDGDATIVRSIIDLAHNLGLDVIAEGVETALAYERLLSWGCDTGQGYYMSRPQPIAAFMDWLAKSRWGTGDAPQEQAPDDQRPRGG